MRKNSKESDDSKDLKDEMQTGDINLRRKAALIAQERNRLGLDGLVGGLEAVIITLSRTCSKRQLRSC